MRSPNLKLDRIRRWPHWAGLIEILVIGIWALWVGREYLDFDPYTWPLGREFGFQLQSHHFWNKLKVCGLCALWNGGINGGMPALAETYGSLLHPLVVLTTTIWGTVVGAKLAVVGAFWMAGAAQWWIGRTLGLGRLGRMWPALIAVGAGHITGRLELPGINLVISTATGSLALAAALELGVSGRRRSAILLGIAGAAALVSGQGYIQFALLGWAPAFLFLVLKPNLRLRPHYREFLLAVLLAILLAGIFLIPLIHFLPSYIKDSDEIFRSAQSLEYIPLNLVISDIEFQKSDLLNKLPYPYLYDLYISWMPVLLAIVSLLFVRRKDARVVLTLVTGMGMMFFIASAIPLHWLAKAAPFLTGVRHPSLIAGMAVPAVLALAGLGLHRLMELDWPELSLNTQRDSESPSFRLNLKWILILPLVFSLRSIARHADDWINVTEMESVYTHIQHWKAGETLWVSPPFGEHHWVEAAMQEGLKLTNVVVPWHWKERLPPAPQIEATRNEQPHGTEFLSTFDEVSLYLHPDSSYTYIETENGRVPCTAAGLGGDLTVQCESDQAGDLTVLENAFRGWWVWEDGRRLRMLPGEWLRTTASPGNHTYRFRYLPLDVLLGALISLSGVGLSFILWRRSNVPTP